MKIERIGKNHRLPGSSSESESESLLLLSESEESDESDEDKTPISLDSSPFIWCRCCGCIGAGGGNLIGLLFMPLTLKWFRLIPLLWLDCIDWLGFIGGGGGGGAGVGWFIFGDDVDTLWWWCWCWQLEWEKY